MKLLLESWRQYLAEGMKTVEELPPNTYIVIKHDEDNPGNFVNIFFADRGEKPASALGRILPDAWRKLPFGKVTIRPASYDGDCAGAWVVAGTVADEGWGPFLYDVAIEWATKNGQGLAPDRSVVSPSATKVWDYYSNNRSDVKSTQLDDLENTLTPDEDDNCRQARASGTKYTTGFAGLGPAKEIPGTEDWAASSLSKKYTKAPTIYNQLDKMGKLIDLTRAPKS
jgi:hypothetical protein